MVRTHVFSLIALSVLVCSGCAGMSDGKTIIKPSAFSSFSPDSNSEVGSRNNPVALGDAVLVNDWKVVVVSVDSDATKAVMAADSFSTPPPTNQQYVLLHVEATYVGDQSGEPSSDLTFKVVGSGGNTFTKSCGYSLDTFSENGEAFPGATVNGNLCFTVDANQIKGSTVSVQGDFMAHDRKFVLIPER